MARKSEKAKGRLEVPYDISRFSFGFSGGTESTHAGTLVGHRSHRHQAKLKMVNIKKRKTLAASYKGLPAAGESIHIIAEGDYDFWTWCPVLCSRIGKGLTVYGSTWTMNRNNVIDALELFDTGVIKRLAFLTGNYFKAREPAVYATMVEGFRKRKQRFCAFENHAKVLLIGSQKKKTYLTVEGSANFTSNPRLEQYVLTNDKKLYEFHRSWMEEALGKTH